MKSRWKDMIYNDFLDCWMVCWDDGKFDYKIRCGDSFELSKKHTWCLQYQMACLRQKKMNTILKSLFNGEGESIFKILENQSETEFGII